MLVLERGHEAVGLDKGCFSLSLAEIFFVFLYRLNLFNVLDKLYFAFTREALADLAQNKSSTEEEFEFSFKTSVTRRGAYEQVLKKRRRRGYKGRRGSVQLRERNEGRGRGA